MQAFGNPNWSDSVSRTKENASEAGGEEIETSLFWGWTESRLQKLDMLIFDEKNPDRWIYKAKRYFTIN